VILVGSTKVTNKIRSYCCRLAKTQKYRTGW